MNRDEIAAFKAQLSGSGWVEAGSSWEWVKGQWRVVFDTSSWLELYVGTSRSHDVPIPSRSELAAWTVNHIEYVLDLEQQLLDRP